ncbi:MAG TPA: inositol monophosphatase [Cytophagales bacterium]|jgi:myo-inositol-1(or 4)-monophosphatase|nr:inositol monophosphatase [Cytophagales bacterium]
MNLNITELLDPVKDIALKAGYFIRNERIHFDPSDIEAKGKNDLVSYVDKEAEKIIVDGLKIILPEAGFITEEGTATKQAEEYNWIIDPLDGTTNFMHGFHPYSVSIALVKNNDPVIGVIYIVSADELYYATSESPAYCNGRPIKVSAVDSYHDGLYITGFPYTKFEGTSPFLNILVDLMQNTHGVRRLGSAAADLCYVAAGSAEGFFEYNLNAWDVAAGVLIVNQAGGVVTDYEGRNDFLFGKRLVAANKTHEGLLRTIQKHWKEKEN